MANGLFIGLITLDLVYLVTELPQSNQKAVAKDYTMAAGGPATNAAVTFSHLGGKATLLGVLGQHAMTGLVRDDLATCKVRVVDLKADSLDFPNISSIMVTEATGDRTVIALNAVNRQVEASQVPAGLLQEVDVILIDGHQMQVSRAIAQQASQIPVVIDGGSWKPGFESVLPLATHVICSAHFHPPGCQNSTDTLDYLENLGIPYLAITNGAKPIQFRTPNQQGWLDIPPVPIVDTLGAGDILHGAFCHYIVETDFLTALQQSAQIATNACQSFGTRQWLKKTDEGSVQK